MEGQSIRTGARAKRPRASLRVLLIVALLVSALGFAPPANAHARHAAEHHHAHGDRPAGEHREDHGKVPAAVHVCPGCAFLAQPVVAAAVAVPAPLPYLRGNARLPRAFDANPIPPPPRRA